MRFVVRSSIVLVVFWFNAAAAQEGYLGHDHDKWHRSFYQMLLRPDTNTPCCNLTDCEVARSLAWERRQEEPRDALRRKIEYCELCSR